MGHLRAPCCRKLGPRTSSSSPWEMKTLGPSQNLSLNPGDLCTQPRLSISAARTGTITSPLSLGAEVSLRRPTSSKQLCRTALLTLNFQVTFSLCFRQQRNQCTANELTTSVSNSQHRLHRRVAWGLKNSDGAGPTSGEADSAGPGHPYFLS